MPKFILNMGHLKITFNAIFCIKNKKFWGKRNTGQK